LLQLDPTRGRYEIHVLLRQFGAERLAQDGEKERDVRNRHSAYYCEHMSQLETSLKDSRHMEARGQIETDYENIIAAWRWGADQGKITLLTNALEAMDVYYAYSGRLEEGEGAFRYVLGVLPEDQSTDALRLRLRLTTSISNYIPAKEIEQRKKLIEKAWELLKFPLLAKEDTRLEEAKLMIRMAEIQEDPKEAVNQYQKAYEIFESLEDRWYMAMLQFEMGHISSQILADDERAIYHIEKSLPMFRELGFKRGIIACLNRLSAMAMFTYELDKIEQYHHESLQLSEEMNDQDALGNAYLFGGFLYVSRGEFTVAYRTFNQALVIAENLGLIGGVIHVSIYLARMKNYLGRYQEALERLLQLKKYSELENSIMLFGLWLLEYGRSLLGKGDNKRAYEPLQASIETFRGRGDMTYLQVALPMLSISLYGSEDYSAMKDVIHEVLRLNAEIRRPSTYGDTFPVLALLELVEGRVEQAVEYYAYGLNFERNAKSEWDYDVVGRHIESAAESLPPDIVAAAKERGRKLDPDIVIKELLLEMEPQDESV